MEVDMEIRVDRDSIYKSVSKVQNIIEKRSNMPILSMILLSTNGSNIHISATDLEISLRQEIPAEIIINFLYFRGDRSISFHDKCFMGDHFYSYFIK